METVAESMLRQEQERRKAAELNRDKAKMALSACEKECLELHEWREKIEELLHEYFGTDPELGLKEHLEDHIRSLL